MKRERVMNLVERFFEDLKDPRSLRNQLHPFETLIGTTLICALAGIDSFSGIATYVELNIDFLEKYFHFPNGSPSHDTYRRLWDTLLPGRFIDCFHEFTIVCRHEILAHKAMHRI